MDDKKKTHTILVKKVGGANWQKNYISEGNDCYYCTEVHEKIKDFGNALGQVHRACKNIFDLRCTKIKDKKTNVAKKKY